MEAEIPQVESCLVLGQLVLDLDKLLTQGCGALPEIMSIKLATSEDLIDSYMQNTLLYHTSDGLGLASMMESTIQGPIEDGLINMNMNMEYEATFLGYAIVASSLAPEDGIFVHGELRKRSELL